jgi:(2Fe-2S) ferredoxin
VVLAACDRDGGGRAAGRLLDEPAEAARLPLPELLEELRAGRTPTGWDDVPRLFLTCTHGRHDVCCAERGRPVAAALDGLAADAAWEVSHIGGDRFAGNVLVLPDGLYYGRVSADRAVDLVTAHGRGDCVPDLLRGRTSLPFAAQAAEVALRRHLGVAALTALRLEQLQRAGARTTTTWAVAGRGSWRVVIQTSHPGPARALTCSTAAAAPPLHTVVELTDTEAPGRGADGWDAAYEGTAVELEPNPRVAETVAPLPPGHALDVGAGTGRHALWLARHGWRVTALDYSTVGLEAAGAVASADQLDVDWQLGDARVWAPAADQPGYDLVLVAFVQLPDVIRRAAGWLAPGGRLLVVGPSQRNLTEGSGTPRDPRLLHSLDTLREAAGDLVVERLEEVTRPTSDGQAVDAVLLARRP